MRLAILLLLCLTLELASGAPAEVELYTCSMHPEVMSREPGNCPVCGMKLQPVRASVSPESGGASSQGRVRIDAGTVQRMNLRTAVVGHGPVRREVRSLGAVTYDESGLHDVTTEYDGWLEKLYVTATGTPVKTGDPLFEVYSPSLYPDLHSDKPTYLIPSDFFAGVSSSRQGRRGLLYRSPASGTIIEKSAVEGQRIREGERVFRLADLSSMWVEAQVYESDLPLVHEGQAVTVRASYVPERAFEGRVERLLPQLDDATRTATARIVLRNPDGFLRAGMFVEVRFVVQVADDAVLVPETAVLRSGQHNTVFLALPGGFFEPREVKLGARSEGGMFQVLAGLRAGETVVTSGQFMLDAESQLREALDKMQRSSAN